MKCNVLQRTCRVVNVLDIQIFLFDLMKSIIDKNLNTRNIHYLACVVQYNFVVGGMNVIKLSIRAECHAYCWYMLNVLTLSVIVSVAILSVLSIVKLC
jgi:hypothetical protein